MNYFVFMKADRGYVREDADRLDGLSYPSLESFYRHNPEDPDDDDKLILFSQEEFREEWNDGDFDIDLEKTHFLAIVNIG